MLKNSQSLQRIVAVSLSVSAVVCGLHVLGCDAKDYANTTESTCTELQNDDRDGMYDVTIEIMQDGQLITLHANKFILNSYEGR